MRETPGQCLQAEGAGPAGETRRDWLSERLGGRGPGRGRDLFQVARPAGTDPAGRGGRPRPPDGRGQPRSPRWLSLLGSSPFSRDAATSGGVSRRPGMAAWSPAAAAPLLRRIRGVSTGRRGPSARPGAGAAEGPRDRGRGSPSFLSFVRSFILSLVDAFSGPGNLRSEKCQDPVRRGTPRPGGGRADRHPNAAHGRGTDRHSNGRSSVDPSSRRHRSPSPESPRGRRACGRVWTVGPSAGLADLDPHKPRIPAVRPSRGHSPRSPTFLSPF